MTARRLAAGLLAGLVATAVLPGSAGAESFLDAIFGRKQAPAAEAPANADASAAARTPLPPRRPASLGAPKEAAAEAAPEPSAAAPAQRVAAAGITAPAPAAPLSERAILDRANAYFNGLSTLVGDFVQVGGDGRKLGGKLYLQRPGRLRFEYEEPSTLEVIADGSSVAVRDRRLATQDLYAISQTPLKFLLSDRVDLARDTTIRSIAAEPDGSVRLILEDRSTLGGTSRITLYFDAGVQTLSQWRILDPQGFQTSVVLSNVERGRRVDQRLFVINYERMLGEGSSR